MSKTKYIKPLILIIIFCGFLTTILSATSGGDTLITKVLPGNTASLQIALLIYAAIIGAIIGFLLGYGIAPIYLFIHKKIFGRGLVYGMQERPEQIKAAREKFRGIFKAFFPALMATNIALMFAFEPSVQTLLDITVSSPNIDDVILSGIISMFIITNYSVIVPIALFSGAWFLIDTGLVHTNKEIVKDKIEPIEINSVGKSFVSFLKDYSGIGILIGLYRFATDVYAMTGGQAHFSIYLFLIIWPFLLSLWCLPAILLMDISWNHRKKYITKLAKKMGIITLLDIEIKTS